MDVSEERIVVDLQKSRAKSVNRRRSEEKVEVAVVDLSLTVRLVCVNQRKEGASKIWKELERMKK
jgi:hypothetical protein